MDLDSAEREVFINEVDEGLNMLGDLLLDFEENPRDQELLNRIFRVAHTIKGNAGFAGLKNMVEIAHAVENLFVLLRGGSVVLDRESSSLLFRGSDAIRQILNEFATGGDTAAIDVSALASQINAEVSKLEASIGTPESGSGSAGSSEGSSVASSPPESSPESDVGLEVPGANCILEIELRKETALPGMRAYLIRSKVMKLGRTLKEIPQSSEYDREGFAGTFAFAISTTADETAIRAAVRSHEIEALNVRFVGAVTAADSKTAVSTFVEDAEDDEDLLFVSQEEDAALVLGSNDARGTRNASADITDVLRVPIRRIDDILNLVGELLSANSAYMALAGEYRTRFGNKGLYGYFRENSEEMSRVAAELQEKVMRVRMIPVGTVFSRFRRVVRDYAASHPEKSVKLIVLGEETEVDKRQIDSIYDPLMHLVRNSLDHGIENSDIRTAQDKPKTGTITLNSYQAGNSIFVEVEDDGQGFDRERILETAIRNGIIKSEQAASMAPDDIINLMFMPGFSTAAHVTDISGRGVGLDVVKRNIEGLNGSIETYSEEGEGTRFTISMPLSMAIITALKVRVESHLLALPIAVILETIKISEEDVKLIESTETIELRDAHIPLIRLGNEIGLDEAARRAEEDLAYAKAHQSLVLESGRIEDKGKKKDQWIIGQMDEDDDDEDQADTDVDTDAEDGQEEWVLGKPAASGKAAARKEPATEAEESEASSTETDAPGVDAKDATVPDDAEQDESVQSDGMDPSPEAAATNATNAKGTEATDETTSNDPEVADADARALKRKARKPVVIVQYNNTRMGLLVDDLIGYEDMVVKSLTKNFEEVEGLSGASILGKGEICLILDVQKMIDGVLGKAAAGYSGVDASFASKQKPQALPHALPAPGSAPASGAARSSAGTATKERDTPIRLSQDEISVLKKIIATGRKNALNAVRRTTENMELGIRLTATRVRTLHRFRERLDEIFAGQEYHACYVNFETGMSGSEAIIISEGNMIKLAGMMYGEDYVPGSQVETVSAVREITNLLAVSFTNAISAVSGIRVLPSAPEYVPDSKRLFEEHLLHEQDPNRPVIMVETEFLLEGEESLLYFFVMPERKDFARMTGSQT